MPIIKSPLLTPKARKDLWKQITVDKLLYLGKKYRPSHNFYQKKNTVIGFCINHSENSPSMYINPTKGYIKCYGCNYYDWDLIRIVAYIAKVTEGEALKILINELGISLHLKLQEEVDQWTTYQHALKKIAEAMNTILAQQDPSMLYMQPAFKWIHDRKLTEVKHLPIGILPEVRHIQPFLDQDQLKIFQALFEDSLSLWTGSIIFVYHLSPHDISGFKLRKDFMRKDEPKSSHFRFVPTTESGQGFFLLGQELYSRMLGYDQKEKKTFAYIVEGETDGCQWYQKMIVEQQSVDAIILATGGKGGANLEPLNDYGIYRAHLVADHPDHEGEKLLMSYLKQTKNMDLRCFNWPLDLKYKDPDEYLRNHTYAEWTNLVVPTEAKNLFSPAYEWSSNKAISELNQTEDLRERLDIIRFYGALIQDAAERDEFILKISEFTPYSEERIRRILVSMDDTMEGFQYRMERALCNEFEFIGEKQNKTGGIIFAWNNSKQIIRQWRLSTQRDLDTFMSYDLGPLKDWIDSYVGIPNFIKIDSKGSLRTLPQVEEELRRYLDLSVKSIKSNLEPLKDFEIKREGVHWFHDPQTGKDGWFIVNGNLRFRGYYDDDDKLHWEQLYVPVVGNTLLQTGKHWTGNILSVADLEEGRDVDFKKLFEKIHTIVKSGWTFKHQTIDSLYLTCFIMYSFLNNAFPYNTLLILNAPRSSGKSSLIKGLFGGKQNKDIHLIENTITFGEDYSPASIRQVMKGSGLNATFDEFEDKGSADRVSRRIREILTMIRGLTGESAEIFRGSPDQENAHLYHLRFCPIVASIHPLRQSADATRFCQISLLNIPGRESPERSVLKLFSAKQITQIRRELTVSTFYHYKKIKKEYDKIRETVDDKKYLQAIEESFGGIPVDVRFLNNLIGAAAVGSTVGYNGLDIIRLFIESREDLLEQRSQQSEHKNLFTAIMSSQLTIRTEGLDSAHIEAKSVRGWLRTTSERQSLNDAWSGVRYLNIKNKHWLVVNWDEVLQTLFKFNKTYQDETSQRLQTMSCDIPENVPHRILKKSKIIKNMFGPGIKASSLSAFDISDEIYNFELNKEEMNVENDELTRTFTVYTNEDNDLDNIDDTDDTDNK